MQSIIVKGWMRYCPNREGARDRNSFCVFVIQICVSYIIQRPHKSFENIVSKPNEYVILISGSCFVFSADRNARPTPE